ncbi:MAG TPA: hypothetical protein VIL65_10045 [Beijerinckiaceae bacterium]|jgi:hypothetical protein
MVQDTAFLKRLWFVVLVVAVCAVGVGLTLYGIKDTLRRIGPHSSAMDLAFAFVSVHVSILDLIEIALLLMTLFGWFLFRRRRAKPPGRSPSDQG